MMMSSFGKVALLLLLISLFRTECHSQSTTATITSAVTAALFPEGTTGQESTIHLADADVNSTETTVSPTIDNKDVGTISIDTASTSVGSTSTVSAPTSNTTSNISVEVTNASDITENSSMTVSGLTTTVPTYVSVTEGTISSSTTHTTMDNSAESITANTTASSDVYRPATTNDVIPENTMVTNVSIVATTAMATKDDNTSHASTTASTVNATTDTKTNQTGNTIPDSTESTPTSNSTATSESTKATIDYTQSTEHVATTNSSDSGVAGSDKDAGSNAGVVLGAVFGSILGCALVCITVYIICGSKKSSSFSHRRLHEDTNTDPVLRLENPESPYDVSYGDSSFYNPTAVEEASYNSGTRETIAMDDIRPR